MYLQYMQHTLKPKYSRQLDIYSETKSEVCLIKMMVLYSFIHLLRNISYVLWRESQSTSRVHIAKQIPGNHHRNFTHLLESEAAGSKAKHRS